MKLNAYDLKFEHIMGKNIIQADALTRDKIKISKIEINEETRDPYNFSLEKMTGAIRK